MMSIVYGVAAGLVISIILGWIIYRLDTKRESRSFSDGLHAGRMIGWSDGWRDAHLVGRRSSEFVEDEMKQAYRRKLLDNMIEETRREQFR